MSTRSERIPFNYQAVPMDVDTKELEMIEAADFESQKKAASSKEPSKVTTKEVKFVSIAVAVIALLAFLTIFSMVANYEFPVLLSGEGSNSEFDDHHRYILRNYDIAKPMSNFLPGLAGIWGVPMWAFYVNRGQGITSFGKFSKDSAIAKFVTAEKAYQQTPFTGFRTFVKGKRAGQDEGFQHMPFFPRLAGESVDKYERNMKIGSNDMVVEEIASELNLKTSVQYFIAPEQDFPALVRSVTFTNLDAKAELDLEVLDGLGRLVPNGLSNGNLDMMGRTMEAWMNVYNVGSAASTGGSVTQPFFHISQDTGDNAQVKLIKDGYFAIAYLDQNPGGEGSKGEKEDLAAHVDRDGQRTLLPFVVDPNLVYDLDTSLTNPSGFFQATEDVTHFVQRPQGTTSRTPCAFAGARLHLAPGASVTVTSVYGYAEDLQTLAGRYLPILRAPKYSQSKRAAASEVVRLVTQKVASQTASPVFDAYIEQDYLDNVLRGGMPIRIGPPGQEKIFHVFSRIHGDIERDYNYFIIDTTYFSQGPGNFRDVNQNRRLDVFHSPFVGDFNLRMFLSLVQADGFNPLTVASTIFKVPFEKIDSVLAAIQVIEDDANQPQFASNFVRDLLRRSFRPGQFFRDCNSVNIRFGVSKDAVVQALVAFAVQDFAAKYDQNGFWVDHWTYTLDLLDDYLSIYPDKEEFVLFDSTPVPFFMSPAHVRPRSSRYSLENSPNPTSTGQKIVRSYKAVAAWGDSDFSADRVAAMNAIFTDPNYIVDNNGAANVWQRSRLSTNANNAPPIMRVSAIAKFIMLGMMKFASLDPFGFGVEMEGGKPGWNDAMNGLPGLLGSGMPETFEMLRMLEYLEGVLQKYHNRVVSLPAEFVDIFLTKVDRALLNYEQQSASANEQEDKPDAIQHWDFQYWDATNNAREAYRQSVVATFDGDFRELTADSLVNYLQRMIKKVQGGISRAMQTTSVSGIAPTYFYYDCTNYTAEVNPADASRPIVHPNSFQLRTLPFFLEGPTRHLKVLKTIEERREVYQLVKKSPLYDAELKMFMISESLASMGQDVGRMKAFSPGWLENQSIWLHMSYKFYLELLRGGLYTEFFEEIQTGLVPFMDHELYGRSPLEAASFIVSSAFPDKRLHGVSYLARLSGSTAEFLSMWAIMMAGHDPFTTISTESGATAREAASGKSLVLQLKPVLPGWLFDPETHEVSFTFLGSVRVTYVNPTHANTWELSGPTRCELSVTEAASAHSVDVDSGILDASWAQKVRDGQVSAIRLYF